MSYDREARGALTSSSWDVGPRSQPGPGRFSGLASPGPELQLRADGRALAERADSGANASRNEIIVVEDLVKRFGDLVAVDAISFTVYEGEIFGILGPNGAGKTTTLEIIETLQPSTSGRILVDGLDVRKDAYAVKRSIGVQLQSAGFYPDLTLVELLRMFGALYDVRVNPRALLKRVQLEEKARATYAKLSGGQKQRFSIISTLVHQPRVIFLDEPTTGLDPQARINLWDTIRDVRDAGTTIVLTTHDMDEAEQLCDRLAIMDRGKILRVASPASLVDDLLATGYRGTQIVRPATLEDVFLNLTGRELRDV